MRFAMQPRERATGGSALPRQQSLVLPAVINPFVRELQLSTPRLLRCFLLGLFLVPLRCLCLLLVLLLAWPLTVVATFLHPLKGTVEPMTGWRRFLCQIVVVGLGRLVFFFMGFRVTVQGRHASSVEAPILAVAPHSSYFDAIVCIVAGLPSTVSRAENLAVPIFGRFLRCFQPVLVSRLDPDSRRNTILEIERRATSGGRWPQPKVGELPVNTQISICRPDANDQPGLAEEA
ncbi:hypothetical protein Z043_124385 [Scleropages formosus]|uniref:Phospholipid/glycerol acyltransferase domain-containing protein n=1 Tax=Scleropages formosus TaxID=113540 RepID=A0A0P7UCG2_SCLFO|nr:hypothetical protein Z043_124385 [Scleropages formosus]